MSERPDLYGFAFFRGYLGIATFASVKHSVRVMQTRRQPEQIRTPLHQALGWVSMAGSGGGVTFALAAWSGVSPILLALSPVGIAVGSDIRSFTTRPAWEHMGWWYGHMGAMIGGGVAFHTAFTVFGAQRLWDYELAGALAVLPWILPALIGIPGSVIWTAYDRRKFARTAHAAA